jgi:hypothetical protein
MPQSTSLRKLRPASCSRAMQISLNEEGPKEKLFVGEPWQSLNRFVEFDTVSPITTSR